VKDSPGTGDGSPKLSTAKRNPGPRRGDGRDGKTSKIGRADFAGGRQGSRPCPRYGKTNSQRGAEGLRAQEKKARGRPGRGHSDAFVSEGQARPTGAGKGAFIRAGWVEKNLVGGQQRAM